MAPAAMAFLLSGAMDGPDTEKMQRLQTILYLLPPL